MQNGIDEMEQKKKTKKKQSSRLLTLSHFILCKFTRGKEIERTDNTPLGPFGRLFNDYIPYTSFRLYNSTIYIILYIK